MRYISRPQKGAEKMKQKMASANIEDSIIQSAEELKWSYTKETLDNRYVAKSSISKLNDDVLCKLQELKMQLDNSKLDLNGAEFHEYCVNSISAFAQKYNVDEALVRGCMYDITNRCSHRFTKPTT